MAALSEAAGSAFIEAVGLASLIGCAIALLGAIVILRFMPPQHLPEDAVEPSPLGAAPTGGP